MNIDNISTVLTVRKGSERVKNKNLKPFYQKNLLAYKIETLLKVKSIKKIIVNINFYKLAAIYESEIKHRDKDYV